MGDGVTGGRSRRAPAGRERAARGAGLGTAATLRYHASLIEVMADAVIATDAEFRVTLWNPAAERLYGYRRDDALGRYARDVASYEGDTSRRHLEAQLDSTGRAHVEFTARRKDGTFVDVELIAIAVAGDDGQVLGHLGIHRDITERKAAEVARARQARQQAAVAELGVRASRAESAVALMQEAVAVVARMLVVELVAVHELLRDDARLLLRAGAGWDPGRVGQAESGDAGGSLVGFAVRSGEAVICDDLADDQRCAPSQLLLDHGVTSAAVVVIPGRRAPFGALGAFSRPPRQFSADELNFLQAIANVLSSAIERAEMGQRVREVREAERRRIARVLHDETLQELSVAITRASRGGEGGAVADDGLVAALQRVGAQVRAAIHELRVDERGTQPFADALGELIDLHRGADPGLETSLAAADLPSLLPGTMASQVLGIVGEALVNARRHAAAKRIEVHVAVEGTSLLAAVADDGGGGARERAPDAHGGHGIAGMRERAELLGGVLRIADRPLGGTLVELRAPLFDQPSPGERVRVLLVDDHVATREAMGLAFAEDDGFVVVGQAGSLAEARSMLAGVDIAIIDLALPDGDGTELIADVRAANPDAQALVLSAQVDRAATARAVDRGAAAVLGKVTHLHEIVSAVRRLRAGETLIPLEEVVALLRLAGRQREHELAEHGLAERLTPREREVLQLMADGLDGHRIAARLHISPRTQRNHVANILAKLRVHSQLQAVMFALRHGLVSVRRDVPAEP
jgi:PAS domain S-box-containing protein